MEQSEDVEVNELLINLYNEQKDYLTNGTMEFLIEFDYIIGDIPIDYKKDNTTITNKVDSFITVYQSEDVLYEVLMYKKLLNIFNLDAYEIDYNIELNYLKIDQRILNGIFNDLNIETLEDLHHAINYHELDSTRILSDGLLYNKVKNNIIGTDLIAKVIDEYKELFSYKELEYEVITEEITETVTNEITEQITQRINQYNRYNVKCNIKALYEYY